jgi:hypothetical protein
MPTGNRLANSAKILEILQRVKDLLWPGPGLAATAASLMSWIVGLYSEVDPFYLWVGSVVCVAGVVWSLVGIRALFSRPRFHRESLYEMRLGPAIAALSDVLRDREELVDRRYVKICVEPGKETCPLARDLREVFIRAGWGEASLAQIQPLEREHMLHPSGVWFDYPTEDREAAHALYKELSLLDPEFRLGLRNERTGNQWTFYIKDRR